MYGLSFMVAALGFVGLSFFVYLNYPKDWRQNRQFNVILLIWHVVGATALVTVFTVFKHIPHEGIKYEVSRVATFYYFVTMLMAMFLAIRLVLLAVHRWYIRLVERPASDRMIRFEAHNARQCSILLCVAFAMCGIGYFNIDILRPTSYDVTINKKSTLDELTICLIADIHAGAGNWEYTYDDLAELIDDAHADVLLIAGDAFDETTSQKDVEYFGRTLRDIAQPKYGTFFVYGNHDDFTEDWAAQQMRNLGVKVLEDQMVVLGDDIQLLGRMDPKHHGMPMEALVQELNVDVTKPTVVLTHRPEDFALMGSLGCDLAMAGHTHGFNIPQFLGSALFEDMYYGIKQYGQMTAITTSGVSAWGFHYKFPAISEVVTIHVHFAA